MRRYRLPVRAVSLSRAAAAAAMRTAMGVALRARVLLLLRRVLVVLLLVRSPLRARILAPPRHLLLAACLLLAWSYPLCSWGTVVCCDGGKNL